VSGLRQAEIELDRKMLAELAVNDPGAFADLVRVAKSSLDKSAPARK
jgi:large subunit ribosomal protein L20